MRALLLFAVRGLGLLTNSGQCTYLRETKKKSVGHVKIRPTKGPLRVDIGHRAYFGSLAQLDIFPNKDLCPYTT